MKNYGSIFRRLRERSGLKQRDVTRMLLDMGVNVRQQSLSRWENDINSPGIEQFIALCRIYSVKDVYGTFMKGEEVTPELNREGMMKLEDYRQLLIESGRYAPRKADMTPLRLVRFYDLAASAGTGDFLDSDSYEMAPVPDGAPGGIDFGLHVNGTSMEPTLTDGGSIWVHMQDTLENGDIGVFYLNGDAYVKEYSVTDEGILLLSHNSKYPPIRINSYDSARIFGKVVYHSS